jgi:predicted hotdog family 3-hydroxylacyl-ACP dehydratase
MMNQEDVILADVLIPHRQRMKLISSVRNAGENGLLAETTVREDWPLHENGTVNSVMCVELMAQSVSALSTWRRGPGTKPRVGLLVGIKEARFYTAVLAVGTPLSIKVDKVSQIGDYAVFKGEVTCGPTLFCDAIIQVIEPQSDILRKTESFAGPASERRM